MRSQVRGIAQHAQRAGARLRLGSREKDLSQAPQDGHDRLRVQLRPGFRVRASRRGRAPLPPEPSRGIRPDRSIDKAGMDDPQTLSAPGGDSYRLEKYPAFFAWVFLAFAGVAALVYPPAGFCVAPFALLFTRLNPYRFLV